MRTCGWSILMQFQALVAEFWAITDKNCTFFDNNCPPSYPFTPHRPGLAYRASATGDPPFLVQNECNSSPFDHQPILIKDHFMGTATNYLN